MKTRIGRMAVLCMGLLLMLSGTAMAADGAWTGNGGDNLWITAANWDVVPGAGDVATVDITNNNPLVNMDVATVYNEIYIGKGSADEVVLTVQNGGHLRQSTSTMFMAVGFGSGSKGRLDMTGGIIDSRDFLVGQRGSADVNISGGTINVARNFALGDRDGHGVSTVDLSGGIVDVANWAGVGAQSGGMQTMTVSGSGYLETGHLSVGINDGQGTLNISGNGHVKLDASSSRLRVGEGFEGAGATGTINMNGGTLDVDSYIGLGYSAGSSGSMDMTAGDITVNAFVVGLQGDGFFDMSGGNLVLNSHVRVGEGGGQGTWNMSGGLVEATNYVCSGWGSSGGETDLIGVSGGEIRTGDLWIGRYGSGTVNLSGGIININYYNSGAYTNGLVFDTNGGNGLLNVAGGTLNWLGGNFTTEVNAFVTSGDIVAYSGGGTLNVVYDSGSDTTMVTATPPGGSWTGNGANNLWTTSGNWNTLPGAGDDAIIDIANNNPLVNMNVVDSYANVYVGRNSSDEVLLTVQAGGTLNAGTTAMWVAENSSSKARVELTGGTINARDLVIGRRGAGIVNVTGGTMNMSRNIVMGDSDGHGVSEFNISAGTVDVVGWTGAGRQSGGMNTINVTGTGYLETGHLSVGLDDGDGTLNISGNGHVKLDASSSRLRVGETGNGSTGTINMDGGTLEVGSYIALGYSAGASGSMDMTAGDVSVNAFVVGLNGAGTFDMSGGNLVLNSHVRVGEGTGEGVWNMSGGLVEAINYVALGWGTTDAGETNLLAMSGGEIQTGDLEIGKAGNGRIELSGGTININYYNAGGELLFDTDSGSGHINLSGGTLNWLYGDHTAEVNAFVASSNIVAYDGVGTVSVDYDSGSDTTIVKANSASYEQWVAGYGLSGADAGTDADPDGDGLANLYEYGLGGNPADPADQGTSPEFGVVNVGGTNWFGYIHPQLPGADSGVSYSLELNTDLIYGTWTNSGYAVTGTNVTGGSLDFVTNVTTTVENSKFIRLVIEKL